MPYGLSWKTNGAIKAERISPRYLNVSRINFKSLDCVRLLPNFRCNGIHPGDNPASRDFSSLKTSLSPTDTAKNIGSIEARQLLNSFELKRPG